MSRIATISTFLGYYKVTAAGMINVLGRSAVEVPPTKVSKGSVTPVTGAALSATIAGIVEDNNLIPVTAISEDVEAGVLGYLTVSQADATTTGVANSVKFGLMIPEVGPNKGVGVLVVTSKVSGVKTIVEIPIEASGG